VQLALRRARSVDQHEAVLRELQADIAGLATLAEQLLQIGAVATAGQLRPEADPGDLVRVVDALPVPGDGAQPTLLPDRWTVDSAGTAAAAVPMPDPVIRQVLLNLLTNAGVHGTPPVQVTVRSVTTGAGQAAEVAVLTVSDGGAGVQADFLPMAAERFSRSDAARGRPGSGLGLSLVNALVQRYDGELRLCSDGRHHRFQRRFDVACHHPPGGTSSTVLLSALR
jgi:signal transduction histidine kinase